MDNIKLVILDNNTNRAAGGFWTTYYIFAPLLLTSSEPTPNDLDIPVLDVGYDYNINGNAPTYPINLISDVNSLVAYAYGYAEANPTFSCRPRSRIICPRTAAIPRISSPERTTSSTPRATIIEQHDNLNTNITYVTFKSDRLPLVKPLLLIPGGKLVADGIEPVLTVLVDAGYKDNKPIPDDPSVQRKMGVDPGEGINHRASAAPWRSGRGRAQRPT